MKPTTCFLVFFALLATVGAASIAAAQPAPGLTQGLFGLQPALAQCGILYDAQLTQFYQGVTSGGVDEEFEYGGKLDQFMIFDCGKLGLCQGLKVIMHAETRFGDDVNQAAAPLNVNMLYPEPEHVTAITSVLFEQALCGGWSAQFGKFNALDLYGFVYPQTGRGVDGFMNASMVIPLTLARTLPLSFLGAGLVKRRGQQIEGGVLVIDSHNITTTSGFDNLFDNGANIVGFWRFFTQCGCLPGSHFFLGTWAAGDFTALDPLDWAFLPGQGIVAPQQTGSWSLLYVGEQKLWVDRCNKNRNIGLLTHWGLADEETNPFRWVGNVAIQGQGLLCGRPSDTMGAGYFYSGLSSEFKSLLGLLDIDDVQGVELYYNAAITPWFQLTTDLQIIQPGARSLDKAIVFGLRGKIRI